MGSEREELEAYRQKVFEELRVRAERLKDIDGAIASNRYLQEASGSSHALRAGNTIKALAGASRHSKLRRDAEELERRRRQAAEDFRRAEQRLEDVDRELNELESTRAEVSIETEGRED